MQKKKQKVQFTALGMNYAKRKESYAWLLQRKKPKAALFFLSDLYALEAISFFSSRGVKIPEEIGIAGYDNISYAEFSVPRLTTISQNVEQKASLAVEILMERINGVEKERENEIDASGHADPQESRYSRSMRKSKSAENVPDLIRGVDTRSHCRTVKNRKSGLSI